MTTRQNSSTERTEAALRHALLRVMAHKPLEEITISELAREANMNRGTFYLHYRNVNDVYDQLFDEIADDMAAVMSKIDCSERCTEEGKVPFCAMVRDSGHYTPMVCEGRFLETFIEKRDVSMPGSLEDIMLEKGYSWEEARAVRTFQMAGCFAVATKLDIGVQDWPKMRNVIDRFIKGGIQELMGESAQEN